MSFAERLKEKLVEKGMTQAQLAFEVEVSGASASRWMSGKQCPSEEKIYAIASVLDCDVEWLKGEEKVEDRELKRNASGAYDPTAYEAIKNVTEKKKDDEEEIIRMPVQRGDIFFVNYNSGVGSEMRGERPAVVVSNDAGNQHSNTVEVVYLTTKQKRPLPTHTSILCRVPSTALCEQIDSVAKERLKDFVRTCTDDEMKRIDKALKVSLALDEEETPIGAEMVKALEEKLETREAYIKTLEETAKKTAKAIRELEDEIEELRATEEFYEEDSEEYEEYAPTDLIKAETERDLYKRMYEELLERMLK